jgi:hypothetical protein
MSDKETTHRNQPDPDEGATMSQAGAEPSGSEMDNWNQANPNPDASGTDTKKA